MNKLLFVVPAVLLFALIGASNARADSYTPTFSCTGLPSSDFGCFYIGNGETAADVSFPSPTIQITVNNNVYSVTLPAGDAPTDSYTYIVGESNGPMVAPYGISLYGGLLIDDQTTGTTDGDSIFLGYLEATPLIGGGTLTFSPVSAAAAEPTPILLLFFGAGLILLMRKRFAQRLPQTA